jgi:hypothetical protein
LPEVLRAPDPTGVGSKDMGKYFLGWLLGVPIFVLVLLYFFFH